MENRERVNGAPRIWDDDECVDRTAISIVKDA